MVRTHQWHCEATNWTMASTAEQVWQRVGTDEGDDSVGCELLQLELVA